MDAVHPAADAKSMRLEALFDTVAIVSGDPDRLQQVVWNLLQRDQVHTCRRKVEVRLCGDYAQIRVSDTGIGISKDFHLCI